MEVIDEFAEVAPQVLHGVPKNEDEDGRDAHERKGPHTLAAGQKARGLAIIVQPHCLLPWSSFLVRAGEKTPPFTCLGVVVGGQSEP